MSSLLRNYILQILVIAIPVALGQAGHILVGVADSIMVGHLGGDGSEEGKLALAAASLANGLFSVVMVFGFGIAYGITPIVANSSKKATPGDLDALLRNGMVLSLITGFALSIVLLLLLPFLDYFDQPAQVVERAIPYFAIIISSLLPLMLFMSLKQYAEGLAITVPSTMVSLGANAINLILNYVLIFGHFGFPSLGLEGAGWATLISRFLMALTLLIVFYRHPQFGGLKISSIFSNLSGELMRRYLKIGIPVGLQLIFEVSTFALAAIMMGWLGAAQMAAHQIALSLAALTYMIATGISSAATVKVGHFAGQGASFQDIRKMALAAFTVVTIFMGGAGLVFVFLKDFLPGIFNNNLEVIAIAADLLIIAALFQISDGIQVVAQGALRGLNDVKVPTAIAFLSYSLMGLTVAYLLGFIFEFGAMGIWTGLLFGLTLSAALQVLRFRRLSSPNQLTTNKILTESK